MSKTCPKCGTSNADERVICTNCGQVLPVAAAPIPAPTGAYAPQGGSPAPAPLPVSQPAPLMPAKRYGVLRTVSGIFNGLAWVGLVFGILTGIVGGLMGFGAATGLQGEAGMGFLGGFVGLLGGMIMGLFWFAAFKVYAEMIKLAIDVEENTRRTAELLETLKK